LLLNAADPSEGVSIEMTPMIDMVFLLLIFFLVATTFHQSEREMQIALPVASASEPISALLQELVVNVDASGKLYVGGRNVSAEDLRAIVSEAIALNPDQKVTVRGDRDAAYAHVVVVLDICKGAGIQEPYLDTVLTGG
jgi:biopolymer transport protein ExbD